MALVNTEKQGELRHERLLDALSYDSETGVFRAKIARSKIRVGDIVGGTSHFRGYRIIRLDWHKYLAHRLAWFYVYGAWPDHLIDHIDGNPLNNAIANLREVTIQQNRWNASLQPREGAILKNIEFKKPSVHVKFSRGPRRIYHKAFPTLCAAIHQRNRLALELYGEFYRVPRKET